MDNDVYGHVNNVTYYSYFNTVVNEFLVRFTGLDFGARGPVGMVVETGCRLHSEIAFPDVLEVGLRVRRLGKTSVTYEIGIFKEGREAPAATGHFVHVYAVPGDMRAVPVPEHARAVLEKLVVAG
ncbi:MAG: acyl-CoA thioesterase [Alphaproteobacteria bacterium]|nr:acyl-CoA thioesterase [Alphaproteobacteria bacterium]